MAFECDYSVVCLSLLLEILLRALELNMQGADARCAESGLGGAGT